MFRKLQYIYLLFTNSFVARPKALRFYLKMTSGFLYLHLGLG